MCPARMRDVERSAAGGTSEHDDAALRRVTFTTHITSSVGWAGVAMAFLALAVIEVTSDDERIVRGAYLVMAPAACLSSCR